MITVDFLLLVAALICFLLASYGIASKIGLLPLGLAFWVLTLLV